MSPTEVNNDAKNLSNDFLTDYITIIWSKRIQPDVEIRCARIYIL